MSAGSRDAGLSLIEVVVAAALFVLFLTGLFASLGISRRAEVLTRQSQAASEAAFGQLGLIDSIGFETVQLSATPTTPLSAYAFDAVFDGNRSLIPASFPDVPLNADDSLTSVDESGMAGRVFVVPDPDSNGSAGLMEIRVTVAWQSADASGRQRVDVVSRRAR